MFAPTEMLITSIYGGVLGDQRVGSSTIDATLLGQAIPFWISMSNSPGSERTACQEGMSSESPEPLAGRLGAPAQRRHRV